MRKKFYAIVVMVCCLVCISSAFVCSAAYVVDGSKITKLGDVRGDDIVDVRDLIRIKKYVSTSEDVTISRSSSDINCDEQVNEEDVVLLRKQLAGMDEIEQGGKYWSDIY